MLILGLDIGASKIRYIVFDKARKKILLSKQVGYQRKTRQEFLRALKEIAEDEGLKKFKFQRVNGGVAGIINDGKLVYSPNFTALLGMNLEKEIRRLFRKPVVLDNDANCFAYAEALLGSAKKYKNIIGFTLGTGFGGGIIIPHPFPKGGGQKSKIAIYRGRGAAGEIGHMIAKIKNQKSKIKITEIEDLCSEKFFHQLGIKDVIRLRLKAEKGDKKAGKIFERFGANLGLVVASIVNIFDPEAIVLGGGISNAYNLFIKKTRETAKKFIVSPASKNIPILKSKLGSSAGAIGAALL